MQTPPPAPGVDRLPAWLLLLIGMPLVNVALVSVGEVRLAPALMVNLLVVVGVSVLGGVRLGLLAGAAATLTVNVLYTEPRLTLDVEHPGDILALALIVVVAGLTAFGSDRVAAAVRRARRVETAAAALARSSAELLGDDPLPHVLHDLRLAFGFSAVSLLRHGTAGWEVMASSGDDPPLRPSTGRLMPVSDPGGIVVAWRGGEPGQEDRLILQAFLDQLAAVLERGELAATAARARQLEAADSVRRGILQSVSHDLRTPLAGIKASVTSLLSADVSFDEADTHELLAVIDAEVDRLDRVVGNLLDAGRLRSGELPVHTGPQWLDEVVAGALDALGLDESEVVVDLGSEVPAALADGPLLERAVSNVVANAVAVQPEGRPVAIRAGFRGAQVWLAVLDNGPGIPEEARERVFEPFQRLGDRSTQAGVGLGLAIASGFTEAMDGALELSDTPGGGLTVTFVLPACEVAA